MIRRDIVGRPEILNNFDLFNDAKDTISWLKMRIETLREKGDNEEATIHEYRLVELEDQWENFRL